MKPHFDSPLTPEQWTAFETTWTAPSNATEMIRAHETAAKNLYGQPFGFTWEMLERLWAQTRRSDGGVIDKIAERIRSLLPPRKSGPRPANRPKQITEVVGFIPALEDAISLAQVAEAASDQRYSQLNARASLRATALLPEHAANALLHHLAFGEFLEHGLERRPMREKFDLFLQLRRPGKNLPLEDKRTMGLQELTELRDETVHPKVKVKMINAPEVTPAAFRILPFRRDPKSWTFQDAIGALGVLDAFLGWYFVDLCDLPKELALRAFSTWVTFDWDRNPTERYTARQSRPIRHAVEHWNLDLGYVGAALKGGAWEIR